MQNNHPYQIPPLTGTFSPDPGSPDLSDPPKIFRYDTSKSEGIVSPVIVDTPGPNNTFTDMPAPYNLHGGEEKKKRRQSAASRPNPHRRYSMKWLSFAWDTAVEVGRWPRITYFLVGLILIAAWIAVMITFANEEDKYQKKNLAGVQGTRGAAPYQVKVKGTLRQFDPEERSLTVSWSIIYVDSDGVSNADFGTNANNTVHWNLYRDVKAVPEDRTSNVSTIDTSGQYRVDNITENPIAVLGAHPWDSVTTDIDFGQEVSEYAWTQPLFGYPFDKWTGSIVFALTDRDFAAMAGLKNSMIIRLDDALLSDSTFNWRIRPVNVTNTCDLPDPADGCELHIDFEGKRPQLVMFAAMVALLVNWTTTLGIFLITCESVVMKRTYILKETDILSVCLTALFALPSVRAILPGSPDFGAIIDLLGIIPNILLISLCTTVIAVSKLRMHRPHHDKDV